jgi:hypothetical protein
MAIFCREGNGPYFGDGELAVKEPLDGIDSCWSWPNQSGYKITIDENGKNKLINKKALGICKFTVVEIEVWQVKFLE